jgi:rhamnosyltransferase
MSIAWRLHFVWRLVQFAVYFLIFSPLRLERLSKMSLGLYHGLKNVRGKLDLVNSSCRAIPATLIDPK